MNTKSARTRASNCSLTFSAFALLSLALASAAAASDETFTTIDFPGATDTRAFGINSRRHIVGRYDSPDGVTHGFLLSEAGEFTTIDFPGALTSAATGINQRGDIAGLYRDAHGVRQGFLRTTEKRDQDENSE